MYQIAEIEDTVRVVPEKFGNTLEETLKQILAEKYESKLDRDMGAIVSIIDVKTDGIGKVIPGDGAAFYNTTFKALTYKPELQEVVDGEVIEVVEFGIFVRLGPLDGLVHVSQITDDYLNYDEAFIAFGTSIFKDSAQRVAIQYVNGLYQLTSGKYCLLFNGDISTSLYNNAEDPQHKQNLIKTEVVIADSLEITFKAFLQQYLTRMVNNKLEVDK